MKRFLTTTLGIALALGSATAVYATQPESTSMRDQSAQPGTDGWITTKVKAELMTTKDIPSTDISVTTTNGVVTLTGILDNKAQVNKSIAVAKTVKGVHRVDSSALTVRD